MDAGVRDAGDAAREEADGARGGREVGALGTGCAHGSDAPSRLQPGCADSQLTGRRAFRDLVSRRDDCWAVSGSRRDVRSCGATRKPAGAVK